MVRTVTITNERARFCSKGCKECYVSDKKQGLRYGPCAVAGVVMGWAKASIAGNFCAYCREHTTN